jgi:hypothetical protein
MAEDFGHTVYKGPEGETTEWEDLQVKLGNFAPRPKPPKAPAFTPRDDADDDPAAAARRDPSSASTKQWLDGRTAQELERLEDDLGDDDRELERYRQQRLAQLRAAAAAPRFGCLDEMPPSAFVATVTEASRRHWVVCHLYREGHTGCGVMDLCLRELAAKYPRTHFVRSPAAGVLKAKAGGGGGGGSVPDSHLPTLLLYRDGACKRHVAGLASFGGEKRVTPEQLALTLNVMGDGRVCSNVAEEEGDEEGGSGGGAAASFQQRKREQEEQMLALAGELARRITLAGRGGGGGGGGGAKGAEEEEEDGTEGRRAGGGGGGVRRSTQRTGGEPDDESSDFD